MNRAIEEFKLYTKDYVAISDNCTLKIDHTMRVVNLCGEIASNLNLNEEDVELAKMCGLLHDIARFEQWKRYETFADRNSCDHGDLGYEILTENNFLRKFIYDDKFDNIILMSVKNHNKYKVPDELTEREKLFTNIVRDADKIDILYLYTIGHINLDIEDKAFSKDIFETLKSKKSINRLLLKTRADRLSVSLGFYFDINFKESLKILEKEKYLEKEINIYKEKTPNDELKKQLDEVFSIIKNYMEKRINLC